MTARPPSRARTFDQSVAIKAEPMEVWRCLTEADAITRWFALSARVTPGPGGSMFWAWGQQVEWPSTITQWRPGRLLELSESHDDGAVRLATQFHLSQPAKGETVVRVVAFGFGDGQKWDDHYDGISHGWRYELLVLRTYLEHHHGQERAACYATVPTAAPFPAAWRRLVAPGAIARQGLPVDARSGERVSFLGPSGRTFSGAALLLESGRLFSMIVDELDGGTLRLELEKCVGVPGAGLLISVWGPKRSLVPTIQREWEIAIARALAAAHPDRVP